MNLYRMNPNNIVNPIHVLNPINELLNTWNAVYALYLVTHIIPTEDNFIHQLNNFPLMYLVLYWLNLENLYPHFIEEEMDLETIGMMEPPDLVYFQVHECELFIQFVRWLQNDNNINNHNENHNENQNDMNNINNQNENQNDNIYENNMNNIYDNINQDENNIHHNIHQNIMNIMNIN